MAQVFRKAVEFYNQTFRSRYGGSFLELSKARHFHVQAPTGWTVSFVGALNFIEPFPTTRARYDIVSMAESADYEVLITEQVVTVGPYFANKVN